MFQHHDHHHCQNAALSAAEAICTKRGSRLTDQRRRVLELVWESHRPIKAYDLLKKLSEDTGRLQPPTIYRALDFLREHGLIHKIDSLNAYTGCRHPDAGHDCFFIICRDCGNADECCSPELKSSITDTAAGHEFSIESITLEISGQCNSCRRSESWYF
jgi:Fur family zinc uptake transcriptional regulator